MERLVIFHEDPARPDAGGALIKTIADYMNTPPYLRRLVFGMRKELSYAGLLPPLNIPTHPQSPMPPEGVYELREGLVVKRGVSYFVEAGLAKPLRLERPIKHGSRVMLLTTRRGGRTRFKIVSKDRLDSYMGFRTTIHPGRLDDAVRAYGYSIATSRTGRAIDEVKEGLAEALRKDLQPLCVAFGSYLRGLREVAEAQGFKLEEVFSEVVNLVPEQGVRSIRTEEAVYAALSIIDLLSRG